MGQVVPEEQMVDLDCVVAVEVVLWFVLSSPLVWIASSSAWVLIVVSSKRQTA